MKALMKVKPEPGLIYTDVEQPRIQNPDDVLFKVEYCAICVGETKVYDWNSWAASDKTLVLPTVLGHEAAGVVVEVGTEGYAVQAGRSHCQRPSDLLRPLPAVSRGIYQHVRKP